jgi:hypothetical protein
MKRLTRSSDPYVECVLLSFQSSLLSKSHNFDQNIYRVYQQLADIFSHVKDIEYNILTEECKLLWDCPSEEIILQEYSVQIQVQSYQRTSIQVSDCFLF